MERKCGVLFDLDGVLIDSEPEYTRFWGEIGREYNLGIDRFEHVIKGSTLPNILNTYFPKNQHQEIIEKHLAFERDIKFAPFTEAMRFVDELSAAGIPKAVVTSSNNAKMAGLYSKLPDFKAKFDAIVTADRVTRSKPDPQPYLIGAKTLGVDISDCFVFEDSLAGIESGLRAGATVIGLATTLPFDAIKEKARKTISDFTDFHVFDMFVVRES